MNKKNMALVIIGLILASPIFLDGQETPGEKSVTEGEFAVELVRMMKLQRLLPPAPLPGDCVEVLEQFGISPLAGWDEDKELSRENYTVIMAMAAGKEDVVHEKAQQACDRNVDIINKRWQLKSELEEKWVALDELFGDGVYFPRGAPLCPYRVRYADKDGDHKVDFHNHFGRRLLKQKH